MTEGARATGPLRVVCKAAEEANHMAGEAERAQDRRRSLLRTAEDLFAAQGYGEGWFRGVRERVGISEEAFRQEFPSPEDLMETLVDAMLEEALEAQSGVLEDPSLDAAEKLRRLFRGLAAWKLRRRAFFRNLALAAYREENLLLLQRLMGVMEKRMVPLTGELFRQGARTGVFSLSDPEEAAEQILWMLRGLGPRVAAVLESPSLAGAEEVVRKFSAISRSMERILGVPEGALGLGALFRETLHAWFETLTGPETGRADPGAL